MKMVICSLNKFKCRKLRAFGEDLGWDGSTKVIVLSDPVWEEIRIARCSTDLDAEEVKSGDVLLVKVWDRFKEQMNWITGEWRKLPPFSIAKW